jgi:hypothetical protein
LRIEFRMRIAIVYLAFLLGSLSLTTAAPRNPTTELLNINGTTWWDGKAINYTGEFQYYGPSKRTINHPEDLAQVHIVDASGKKHYITSVPKADMNNTAKYYNLIVDYANKHNITGTKKLGKRESKPMPFCWDTYYQGYSQNSWGYYYGNWGQVGNCFYCYQCSVSTTQTDGVSFTYTAEVDVKFSDVIQANFGFWYGQQWSTSHTFTCSWGPGTPLMNGATNYGCNSMWFQPEYSWHWGYAWYNGGWMCNDGTSAITYGDGTDMLVSQPVLDNNGNAAGNWGCGSGCFNAANGCNPFGWDCCHANSGGYMGW